MDNYIVGYSMQVPFCEQRTLATLRLLVITYYNDSQAKRIRENRTWHDNIIIALSRGGGNNGADMV